MVGGVGCSRWDEIVLTHENLAQEHSAAARRPTMVACSICGTDVEIGGEIEASSVAPCVAHAASHLAARVSSNRTLARYVKRIREETFSDTTHHTHLHHVFSPC